MVEKSPSKPQPIKPTSPSKVPTGNPGTYDPKPQPQIEHAQSKKR